MQLDLSCASAVKSLLGDDGDARGVFDTQSGHSRLSLSNITQASIVRSNSVACCVKSNCLSRCLDCADVSSVPVSRCGRSSLGDICGQNAIFTAFAVGPPAAELDSTRMSGTRSSRGAILGVVEPPRSEMLCRLQRHEITLEQYLDYSAEKAVEHLKGLVDAERLQFIQSMIRDQMTTDPVALHYLQQATGLDIEGYKAS